MASTDNQLSLRALAHINADRSIERHSPNETILAPFIISTGYTIQTHHDVDRVIEGYIAGEELELAKMVLEEVYQKTSEVRADVESGLDMFTIAIMRNLEKVTNGNARELNLVLAQPNFSGLKKEYEAANNRRSKKENLLINIRQKYGEEALDHPMFVGWQSFTEGKCQYLTQLVKSYQNFKAAQIACIRVVLARFARGKGRVTTDLQPGDIRGAIEAADRGMPITREEVEAAVRGLRSHAQHAQAREGRQIGYKDDVRINEKINWYVMYEIGEDDSRKLAFPGEPSSPPTKLGSSMSAQGEVDDIDSELNESELSDIDEDLIADHEEADGEDSGPSKSVALRAMARSLGSNSSDINRLRSLRQRSIRQLRSLRQRSNDGSDDETSDEEDSERSRGFKRRRLRGPDDEYEPESEDDFEPIGRGKTKAAADDDYQCQCNNITSADRAAGLYKPCHKALRIKISNCGSLLESASHRADVTALMNEAHRALATRGEKVCFRHCWFLVDRAGFYKRGFNYAAMRDCIKWYAEKGDDIIRHLGTDEAFYKFKRIARIEGPYDRLGMYNFPVAPEDDPTLFDLTQKAAQRVLSDISPGTFDFFHETGNIVMPLLQWWDDFGLIEKFKEEARMYSYHFRRVPGQAKQGWLRNCYHSVFQQVMRMDPLYYTVYGCLRPDLNTNLVSYPYYMKCANPGDVSEFLHIDINVADALENTQMLNCIQGSVSLTKEDHMSCTVILPKIHRQLDSYWKVLTSRGLVKSKGFINKVDARWWKKEDERRFKTKWQYVIAHPGDVRISHSGLPHGSSGPTVTERITALPWFIGVREDGQSLDHLRAGTLDELGAAHARLLVGKTSPSGKPNAYGNIHAPFAAATHVRSPAPICDAVLGKIRHSDPSVVAQKRILFGRDHAKRQQLIIQIRSELAKNALEALRMVERFEREAFGDVSFYKLQDDGHQINLDKPDNIASPNIAPPDVPDDVDDVQDKLRAMHDEEVEDDLLRGVNPNHITKARPDMTSDTASSGAGTHTTEMEDSEPEEDAPGEDDDEEMDEQPTPGTRPLKPGVTILDNDVLPIIMPREYRREVNELYAPRS